MAFLLVLSCICADQVPAAESEIPKNVRAYFKRADAARAELATSLQAQIAELDVEIRGEANPSRKAALRRQLIQVEKTFEELKRSKVFAYLPDTPAIDDIGVLRPARVIAVIDDSTAIVWSPNWMVVLTGTETKSLKARRDVSLPDGWRVSATATENETIKRHLNGNSYYIVEPIKKKEIEKYRIQYETEKKDPKGAAAPVANVAPNPPAVAKPLPAAGGEVPKNVRDYFRRADATKASLTKFHEVGISDLEIAIRGEANPQIEAALRRRLAQAKDAFDEFKQSKPIAFFTSEPKPGDIGYWGQSEILAVIDDHVALVRLKQSPFSQFVVSGIDTTSMKVGKEYSTAETWKITMTKADDERVLRQPRGNRSPVIEKFDVEKYREQYQVEKKAGLYEAEEEAERKAKR